VDSVRTPLTGVAPLLLALLALAAPASAATTHHVDSTATDDDGFCGAPSMDCTVREAIEHSAAGDTVALPAGPYVLDSSLTVDHALTIEGAGAQDTTIVGNGHRVFLILAGAQVIRRLTIAGGNADFSFSGGGVYNNSGQAMLLEDARITGSTVDYDNSGSLNNAGGAGLYSTGDVTVDGGELSGNSLFLNFGQAILNSGGGAIWAGGKLTLRDTELHDNGISLSSGEDGVYPSVQNGGGAVYAAGGLTATGLTVTQHNATVVAGDGEPMRVGGGAIYASGGEVTITNSTIHNNSAHIDVLVVDNGGGGLYSRDATTALRNVTLTGNRTRGGTGGGVYREDGSVTARNTIIAGNTSDPAFGDGTPDNCDAPIVSAGHNLESANTCGLGAAGDLRGTDPELGALAANGGPTRTRAPLRGSPVIDAGSACALFDQRGVPRPRGRACDIGAVEARVPTVVTGGFGKAGYGSALLKGSVDPGGRPTSYVFQYGRTAAYGRTTKARAAGAASATVAAAIRASGLKPGKTYHYRLVANNPAGVSAGADRTFRTKAPGENPFRLPTGTGCLDPQKLVFKPRRPGGVRLVRVRAFFGGDMVLDRARKRGIERVTVKDLPAGRFKLKVIANFADGARIGRTRELFGC
jgi:hypothetical protein